MPSSDNLKAVDNLEPLSNLIDEIDAKLINESKSQNVTTLIEEVTNEETGESNPNFVYDETPKHTATLIDENGVKSQLPSVDDCINLRDENDRLRLQVEALVSWQSHASAECAKYRKDYDDLKKKYDEEAVKYRKDELIDLIKNL